MITEDKGAVRLFIAIIFASCIGCTAQMVKQPGGFSDSPYAPINEASSTGVVKYLNQGAKDVIKARREDAYKKMYKSCKGSYEIVNEGPVKEGGSAYTIGESIVWSDWKYWYIEFRCVANKP